jgi:hypothetical protein
MSSQEELSDHIRQRPWALALASTVFVLAGIGLVMSGAISGVFDYSATTVHIVGGAAIVLGIGGLLVAAARMGVRR